MGDDLVADRDVRHLGAGGIDDPGCIAAADVEVLGRARLLADRDDVDRDAARGPDVVVVDPGGHDCHEHLVRPDRRDRNLFQAKGVCRLSEPVLPHYHRQHPLRDFSRRR